MTQHVRAWLGTVARRLPARVVRAVSGDPFGDRFATFERDDGARIPLLAGYRNHVKSRWRVFWWPTRVLLELRSRVELPPAQDELATLIQTGRALPVPYASVVEAVASLRDLYPEHLREVPGRVDPRLGIPVLELVPRRQDAVAAAAMYRAEAENLRASVARYGLRLEGARVLDVGAGSAYLSFALAGLGAEVVAADIDLDYVFAGERAEVRALLEGAERRTRLVQADVHALPFADGAFDLVVSMTAVEHFADLRRAFREIARVLAPGGLTFHGVDPWFGVKGGHSLCTLDFPWGHVRLGRAELERYLAVLRPHEAEDAVAFLRSGVQDPPLTLHESRREVTAAGLELLEWSETPLPARSPHRGLVTRELLRDCRRQYPTVTRDDLLTLTYSFVARRAWPSIVAAARPERPGRCQRGGSKRPRRTSRLSLARRRSNV